MENLSLAKKYDKMFGKFECRQNKELFLNLGIVKSLDIVKSMCKCELCVTHTVLSANKKQQLQSVVLFQSNQKFT